MTGLSVPVRVSEDVKSGDGRLTQLFLQNSKTRIESLQSTVTSLQSQIDLLKSGKTNNKDQSSASIKASVRFKGDSVSTSVELLSSFNITKVERQSTGIFKIFFSAPMSDANYTFAGCVSRSATDSANSPIEYTANPRTASEFSIYTLDVNAASVGLINPANVSLIIFGD